MSTLSNTPVFCLLPHSQWPVYCKLVRVFEEELKSHTGKVECIRKAEIECDNPWLQVAWRAQGFTTTDKTNIIVPVFLMQQCILPDISQNGHDCKINVDFRHQRYRFTQVNNMTPGTNVVTWGRQGGIYVGKIYFTGSDVSELSKREVAPSDLNVFVAFNQRIDEFKSNLLSEVGSWGYVYRVHWAKQIFLKEFTKLMDVSEITNFHFEKHSSGTLEVQCEKRINFHPTEVIVSVSPPQNIVGKLAPFQTFPEANKNGPLKPSPLIRSKVSSDGKLLKISGLKNHESVPPKASNNKKTNAQKSYATVLAAPVAKNTQNYALTNENGIQTKSTTKPQPNFSGNNKCVAYQGQNNETPLKPIRKSKFNGKGTMKYKLMDDTKGPKSSKRHTPALIHLKADCIAIDKKHTLKTMVGLSVNDSVLANVNGMMSVGEIDMFCTIGDNESTIYAAVVFDTPLKHPFFVEHDKQYCFERCKSNTFVLIEMSMLLLKTADGTEPLILLRNTEMGKPSLPRQSQEIQAIDYKTEEFRMETFVNVPIQYDNETQFQLRGIEGSNNSCYADSVIFSLFAFTTVFDHYLENPSTEKHSQRVTHNRSICNILKYDIVSTLRKTGTLKSNAVQKLRRALAIYNKSFVSDWMDAEDFILTLFGDVCDGPKFYSFNSDAEDFVFQMHVEFDKKFHNTNLYTLLKQSLDEIDIKLRAAPSPAFIIKLPVSNGQPVYDNLIPNLTISLDPIMDKSIKSADSYNTLCLKAVICLQSNHYTSFVRTGVNKYSDWVFHDSKPTTGDPEVHRIPDLSVLIENSQSSNKWFDYLVRNAFICVYEPLALQETLL
ncbi:Ubiquitin carboxyl-terminal hydrolase CYLD [Orchesella cincta]|uniref:Ubiquitin carboxyl-terminal hydrolase CYLD n=1 Tax=Orchesella cincta TaxID=48709 RepID=A0A1D2ML37_ORCCI|nr:Ubiquitin carboxyl-terminal hydrolase CYLD [Orchesella cincta]